MVVSTWHRNRADRPAQIPVKYWLEPGDGDLRVRLTTIDGRQHMVLTINAEEMRGLRNQLTFRLKQMGVADV